MTGIARALWDGFRLRCPRCHRGRMFERGFTMRPSCAVCSLAFERSSGEITGGMGINSAITLFFVCCFSFFALLPNIPLVPLLLAMLVFAVVFPIAFYRSSRGMWASILYLTGDNDEPD
jgi:uncharacterized protein (DUF983 family)